jgi:hypothetical protein
MGRLLALTATFRLGYKGLPGFHLLSRLLVLPVDIKLSLKGFLGTNTLAYFVSVTKNVF